MYTKQELCVSCFSIFNEEMGSFTYSVKSECLKTNFLDIELALCYVCYKQAIKAENFINNVHKNQVLFENFGWIDKETYQRTRNDNEKVTVLSHKRLESIDFVETNMAESPQDVHFELLMCANEVVEQNDAKIEMDIKSETADDVNDYSLDFEMEPKYESDMEGSVKAEEGFGNKIKTKPNIKPQLRKKSSLKKSNKKFKKKLGKNDVNKKLKFKKCFEDDVIEPLYIPLKECIESKRARATDPEFLSAPYKCKDCVKIFRYRATCEKHLRKHKESSGQHVCEICKLRFPSTEKLSVHRKYHTVRYKCKECGCTRINRTALMDHWRKFHSADPQVFRCPHCPKDFMGRMSLHKHLRNSHSLSARVTCTLCNKTYANGHVLLTHTELMHTSEAPPKKYRCPECGKYFTSPSHVQKHLSTHTEKRDFYCVECDKSFKTDATLKAHLKYATPHVICADLRFDCELCGKKFANKRALDRHKAGAHLNIRPYQCDICDKTYTSKHTLREHLRVIHEGFTRPLRYQCHMCERMFARSHVLKSHIRTHTGERPYQCAECPARFSQPSVLRTHTRLIHLRQTRDGKSKHSN